MIEKRWRIACIVGTRPNFIKIAPIIRALEATSIETTLVHTGQHYDPDLNQTFFEQLDIPVPDHSLSVGSGSHATQTAEIMMRFEKVIESDRPDAVLVVGDVNSTIACGLVASKQQIPVVHVEAGLRSRDRDMPEEINRLLTDQLADVLYVTERSACTNLLREGIPESAVEFVGNVMVDSLLASRAKTESAAKILSSLGVDMRNRSIERGFALVTLHRPSNVDDGPTLTGLIDVLGRIGTMLPVIFPIHPRTKARLEQFGLLRRMQSEDIIVLPPIGYLEMTGLMANARMVLTDSGGLQEETTALNVPCLTLRNNTERPITVEQGTNTIVGTQAEIILGEVRKILATGGKRGHIPELWDGHAAERIAASLQSRFFEGRMRRNEGQPT